GDKRRTKRMIQVAGEAAAKPDAATPEQSERWADCKAAYRLFDQKQVTFEAVTAPHRTMARAVGPGTGLVINETTELGFGYGREISGAGRTGSANGCGFFLHSALVVATEGSEIVGLGGQELYTRPWEKIERVSSPQRRKRPRETDVWGRVIDQ